MKERPILFSGPMVRAILEGRKTQTRRVVKPQPPVWLEKDLWYGRGTNVLPGHKSFFATTPSGRTANVDYQPKCPYGQPGDRLWVREAWSKALHGCGVELLERWEPGKEGPFGVGAIYAATPHPGYSVGKWKPSIHMPRWASRITLEITGVRVERLQDISEADAQAEGVEGPAYPSVEGGWIRDSNALWAGGYAALWESINGPESWDANPWVFVVEFKRLIS